MKTIYLRGGKATNTAVQILTHHLSALEHEVVRHRDLPHDVIVCWGMSCTRETPTLNGNVNKFDKWEAILQFHRHKISAPIVFPIRELEHHAFRFPLLARNRTHRGGLDIKVVNDWREAYAVNAKGDKDFFSVYIPTETEYRVWVFKNRAFAVYEKLYKGEGEYLGIQRNRHFGFKFEKQDELLQDEALSTLSIAAVKALNMDFGAADVILGKDGKYYVLEVNSMPNISSLKKSSGIRLANQISRWAESL